MSDQVQTAGSVLLFASSNKGKFAEVLETAGGFHLKVTNPDLLQQQLSAQNKGSIKSPPPSVTEDADTYYGNAKLKADAFFEWSGGLPSMADDTGLEVAALNGAPGLYSSRFAGPQQNPAQNLALLLDMLKGETCREALFRCVLCLRLDASTVLTSEAVLPGEIAPARQGKGGFGYDSVFYIPEYGRTLAELKEEGVPIKTHRILACEKLFTEYKGLR